MDEQYGHPSHQHELSTPDHDSLSSVWTDQVDLYSGRTVNADFAAMASIRAHHPQHHVSWFKIDACDLLGYAAAGHASAEFVSSSEHYKMMIQYKPAKHRLAGAGRTPGELEGVVTFGLYKYVWSGREYLYYHLGVPGNRAPSGNGFLLSSRDGPGVVVKGGRCNVSDDLLWAGGHWTDQLHNEVYVFDNGNWTKNADVWKMVMASAWDNVVIDARTKTSVMNDVDGFFDGQQLYADLQVPWKRGIIFHGVPGNGKTMTVKVVMATLQNRRVPIPSLYVKSFKRGGGSQTTIQNIFSRARLMAPCLLIFEDLDTLVTDSSRTYFLNEVDGLESNDGILIIGSVNDLDKLDPAVRDRPSRFDRKYHFNLPGEEDRTTYAHFWQKKLEKGNKTRIEDEACNFIAKMTDGFSFAYINELFIASLLVVARGGSGLNQFAFASLESLEKALAELEAGLEAEKRSLSAVEKSFRQAKITSCSRRKALRALEIPPALENNALITAMYEQAQILLEDMDSGIVLKQQEEPLKSRLAARRALMHG